MEEFMDSYKIPRHKVFISFHNDDKDFKEYLVQLTEYNPETKKSQSIFDDYSVGDIDDSKMSDEEVRIKIRDEFIKEATVLVLLCGKETKYRKFVDWELHAAMYDTEKNPKLGIVVINLPTIEGKNCIHAGQEDEKSLMSDNTNWFRIETRAEFENKYQSLPSRLIDNLISEANDEDIVHITITEWNTIANDCGVLKTLIDNAFKRSRDKDKHYNHSAPLRCRNSRG